MKRHPMAKQKINGRASRVAPATGSRIVLAQAQQVTTAAGAISRIADEVADGAEQQIRAIDRATSGVNEMGDPRRRQRLRIAAGLTRGARRAVLGILKVAKEVVVLEGRSQHHQAIESRRKRASRSPTGAPVRAGHLFR